MPLWYFVNQRESECFYDIVVSNIVVFQQTAVFFFFLLYSNNNFQQFKKKTPNSSKIWQSFELVKIVLIRLIYCYKVSSMYVPLILEQFGVAAIRYC